MTSREMSELGYEMRELTVVRFFDNRTDARWFYRDHEELGTIRTLCDGAVPANPKEVLSLAREAFGSDCSVLW